MKSKPIVLIAFLEQDNLGIGYVGSVLHSQGLKVYVLDFRLGKQAILDRLKVIDPIVVGFSVIFQRFINDFQDLIKYLRKNGINCHFTAGGHYPSLRHKQLLNLIPELNSVVLFEGEITFLELVQALQDEQEWQNIAGLAYHHNMGILANKLRPLEPDIDQFPPPLRQPLRELAFGKKFATILAGRGCIYNCSFCSIHEFYSQPPGPLKRVRSPEMVVKEMDLLYNEKDCSIFMFQDDDFPITYNKDKWLNDFLHHLDENKLSDKVMWKINCRTDEIHPESLKRMKDHGLFLVYLGIESGTDEGLRQMNKHITAETNLRAAQCIKDHNIEFDYGYMLFDPESTFEKIQANLDFLDKLVSDGSSPVTFCKMMPYAGTKIEKQLISQGRLIGEVGAEDYHFNDPRIDNLYNLMVPTFEKWIGSHSGLLNLARWVRHFLMVYQYYFNSTPEFEELVKETKHTIAESNHTFIDTTRVLIDLCISDSSKMDNGKFSGIQNRVQSMHKSYCQKLEQVIENLNSIERQPLR
jgi:radical SAM superfamily enzyme YgiQ (UPF0313 family)